jgi:hypothetical protein
MGFFGRLLGVEDQPEPRAGRSASGVARALSPEEQALERYRYMVRTAPPEALEQAHAEAFAKLTPEQRQRVLAELAQAAPAAERAAVSATPVADERALARVATRAETRAPGTVERVLGSGGMGLGASLLSSFAMGFAGSMVAQAFFSALPDFGGDAPADESTADESTADASTADAGAEDDGYADDGGDFGDYEV